ncbi:phosphomethylpyrimidine kinase [Methanoplanus sp. FWC-SCC4]|uniref:Phosphomethylpyrimidine kinase n=1 Tax=Methanochimaera problematica TaxID=2609417 RepID=A0AA97FBB7_9EURY|nr:thiamine-phosphate synthase family protein [Methanoplanus sp. FWC-SCC4]WOF16250.1 phosphomethylpyrimidine kinase [Methanoplanus sp. FWC-SCC4]
MDSENREEVIKKLSLALQKISQQMPVSFIPEVGMNIVFALPDAKTNMDVAGVEGRIVKKGDRVFPVGDIKFGASDHIARIVLTAMKFDPEVRSAANIRFSEEAVSKLEELLFEVRSFDREKEPAGVSTMDWGVAFCCKLDDVPDIIFDRGAMGKEPMIRFLADDPQTIANNIIMLFERINNKN